MVNFQDASGLLVNDDIRTWGIFISVVYATCSSISFGNRNGSGSGNGGREQSGAVVAPAIAVAKADAATGGAPDKKSANKKVSSNGHGKKADTSDTSAKPDAKTKTSAKSEDEASQTRKRLIDRIGRRD